MALPKAPMPTDTVELSGGPVDIVGLKYGQIKLIQKMGAEASDIAAISWATGTDKAEVAEWLEAVPAGDVKILLAAISEISGLSEGARFPQRATDDAGGAGTTERD